LNCQVRRDITASTTKAIFNLLYPRIVRFIQGEVGFQQQGYCLQCSISILVCPLSIVSFIQGKVESSCLRKEDLYRYSIKEGLKARIDSSRSSQAVQVRRIYTDTLLLPVCDKASQGSTASGRMAKREGIYADMLL
jgi:hypothetical protein